MAAACRGFSNFAIAFVLTLENTDDIYPIWADKEPVVECVVDTFSQTARASSRSSMVRADLMGGHSHVTDTGVNVYVWQRGTAFIARGRYQGRPFGKTLGNIATATKTLRQLLCDIENGAFTQPSEARNAPLQSGRVPQLTLRALANEFLKEKRKLRGKKTADTYRSRLGPVLDFAELPNSLRRWPLAANIDLDFATDLRSFLYQHQTTRNGRPGSQRKPLSARQVFNIMDTTRTMLYWARRAEVRKLPAEWVNPMTEDIVGSPPAKDPLRAVKLPTELRMKLIGAMDPWQLCQLSLSLVLPLRPEQAAGLLVSDVDLERSWLSFATRLGGSDFTKGHTTFKVPFPTELRAIIEHCIAGRADGPLLRPRNLVAGKKSVPPASIEPVAERFAAYLATLPSDEVLNENDRKQQFRKFLAGSGGISPGALAKAFKNVAGDAGLGGVTLKDAREAVSTEMERAGMPFLALKYLTGHTTKDIMDHYVSLDPTAEMAKYFATIKPLLAAITERWEHFSVTAAGPENCIDSQQQSV
jgi:integrase